MTLIFRFVLGTCIARIGLRTSSVQELRPSGILHPRWIVLCGPCVGLVHCGLVRLAAAAAGRGAGRGDGPAAMYRSSNVSLYTDLSTAEANALLERLEATLRGAG